MPAQRYSPQEVAVVAGTPLAAVQKAITARAIPAHAVGPARRRQLDRTALFAFALAEALPREIRVSPGTAYTLLSGAPDPTDGQELLVGDVVRIDANKALAPTLRRLALYETARRIVVKDPAIMGGTPTIRGTRITAQSIRGRLDDGDSIESILEDYPYLDGDTVEAVALFASANPPRGRPNGARWRHAS